MREGLPGRCSNASLWKGLTEPCVCACPQPSRAGWGGRAEGE